MKRYMVIGLFLGISLSLLAQAGKEQAKFDYRVLLTNNWVFYAPQTPTVQVVAKNTSNATEVATLQLEVTTDQYRPITTLGQTINLAKNDSTQIDFSFILPTPGFYRCQLIEKTANGQSTEVKKFNIGYEPTAIVSLPDAQPDLKEFWDTTKAELAKVAPEYKLTLIPDSSDNRRKLYRLTMKSFGGVEISGYYSTPTKKGKYPAIISYMGYGSKPWAPGGTPGYVEFVLSVRGQALQESVNTYGDWITYGLDAKENYYYRGAFMDLIRAIDFVASRPEVNTGQIFAEGGSQGGAFSLAACALDSRIRAAAPTIPFLSDYPDYFKIVHWPAQPILNKQREMGLSDAHLYKLLSYFDIKNLAGWIQCPVLMGVGLQDEVCPPHTNFAGFNRITSEKKYYIYPLNGHNTPDSWWNTKMEFFGTMLK
ncbi:acetylxylan esterase [Bacteroides sp. 51]|uniref:acetylxylan esterase n=1 Tax=Bacteroides sp. 51 TaxID=2302938 RepID=UPI0013D23AA9|nr:acetylxylan esterase [Bacteroides sp. 51]NDV83166.1 acetyl xylan esterase [Bacteroides sp. 51]